MLDMLIAGYDAVGEQGQGRFEKITRDLFPVSLDNIWEPAMLLPTERGVEQFGSSSGS